MALADGVLAVDEERVVLQSRFGADFEHGRVGKAVAVADDEIIQ